MRWLGTRGYLGAGLCKVRKCVCACTKRGRVSAAVAYLDGACRRGRQKNSSFLSASLLARDPFEEEGGGRWLFPGFPIPWMQSMHLPFSCIYPPVGWQRCCWFVCPSCPVVLLAISSGGAPAVAAESMNDSDSTTPQLGETSATVLT